MRNRACVSLVAGICVVLAGAFLVTEFIVVPHAVFQPDVRIHDSPATIGLEFSDVALRTVDAQTLLGWYIPGKPGTLTVLYCHGNAGNRSTRLGVLMALHQLGLSVFIFDYRGYGGGTGHPSEGGTYRDADAAWHYLADTRGINNSAIILYGESLGGPVAAHIAAEHQPAGLILDSTFPRLSDVVAAHIPRFFADILTPFQYDTLSALGGVRCPVVVLSSTDDRVVPFQLGRHLYSAVHPPKRFGELSGPHVQGYRYSPTQYEESIHWLVDEIASAR